MYRAHYMEFKYEDRDRVMSIFNKYRDLEWFDDYRIYEDTAHGANRLTLKLHPYVSSDLEIMKNEFLEAGIEVF